MFANAESAPQDYQRINMMRDRGIIYYPNGSGRDTYIYNDNGGFALMKKPRPQFHPATLIDNSNQPRREKFPFLHSRPINYSQDGTGRDTYIITGNGGLMHSPGPRKEYRHAFKDSLRSYQRNPFYLQQRKIGRYQKFEKKQQLDKDES